MAHTYVQALYDYAGGEGKVSTEVYIISHVPARLDSFCMVHMCTHTHTHTHMPTTNNKTARYTWLRLMCERIAIVLEAYECSYVHE